MNPSAFLQKLVSDSNTIKLISIESEGALVPQAAGRVFRRVLAVPFSSGKSGP